MEHNSQPSSDADWDSCNSYRRYMVYNTTILAIIYFQHNISEYQLCCIWLIKLLSILLDATVSDPLYVKQRAGSFIYNKVSHTSNSLWIHWDAGSTSQKIFYGDEIELVSDDGTVLSAIDMAGQFGINSQPNYGYFRIKDPQFITCTYTQMADYQSTLRGKYIVLGYNAQNYNGRSTAAVKKGNTNGDYSTYNGHYWTQNFTAFYLHPNATISTFAYNALYGPAIENVDHLVGFDVSSYEPEISTRRPAEETGYVITETPGLSNVLRYIKLKTSVSALPFVISVPDYPKLIQISFQNWGGYSGAVMSFEGGAVRPLTNLTNGPTVTCSITSRYTVRCIGASNVSFPTNAYVIVFY